MSVPELHVPGLHVPGLHVAVALDGTGWHPASWREPGARPGELLTAAYWADLVREAEVGLLDLVTFEDAFAMEPDDRVDRVRGRLDAVLVATRVAPVTRHIGLVPSVIATHTEPFHVAKAVATLDWVSQGRAGVRVRASLRADEAALQGRGPAPEPAQALAEVADHIEVQRRLWDSWEDDAEIRDAATGRFVDRDKLHYIDFTGPFFSVRGPAITPRPPQGQPVVAALAHGSDALGLVARSADLGFVTPRTVEDAAALARAVRAEETGPDRTHLLGDVLVFLDDRPGAAARRRAHLDEQAGKETTSDALIFTGTPVELADLVTAWQAAGLSGGPAAARRPHPRPAVDHSRPRAGAATTRCVPHVVRGDDPARALRPAAARQPLRGMRSPMSTHRPMHLAAHFPGVNNTTVWSDPAAGSHIEFASFVHFAQTAERAKFDFLFLAEGLRLREQNGLIYDLDVVGRPDTFGILTALAAVTDRLGLAGTINSTFNEPYEVARQLASLDHLSQGRAAWNVVTSWDAFTGENFRRGGYLAQDQRYVRAKEFLDATRVLWDSWSGTDVVADPETGTYLARPDAGAFTVRSTQFDITGRFGVPRSPQGHPVIIQAGDSEEGREFAASDAEVIFSRYATPAVAQDFYRDVKGRMARHGRTSDDLAILPAATFVLGDTDADAQEQARIVRHQQVSPQTAIRFLEQLWNRDLSDHDPDGPLPTVDPLVGDNTIARGRASVRQHRNPIDTADEWRALATEKGLTTREVIIEVTGRQTFVGSPGTVADAMTLFVDTRACDGFVLVPHITPGGLDAFADTVVPLLQERGAFRTDYTGTTLRDHLRS